LAISKQRKHELVELYKKWLNESDALVITQYHGLTVSDISKLRAGIRETDGEFHVVKNTLVKMAMDEAEKSKAAT